VLWLCSDGAAYMLGHALPVDGGVVLGGTGTRFDDLVGSPQVDGSRYCRQVVAQPTTVPYMSLS